MSADREAAKDLIEVLKDGAEGFADAAEKLADSDRPDIAPKFTEFAQQRAGFAAELERMAAAYGDDIDEDGSMLATVHRTWMSIKDAISGSDPVGVLDAAVQGENHAVEAYEEALGKHISPDLRTTVQRQFDQVKEAQQAVLKLQHVKS